MSETTKKPVCFVTNVYDHQYYSLGAYYLERSAKYFHPEIPFYTLGTEWIEREGGLNGTWIPQTLGQFLDEYVWVVRLDADCIITGRLDELLEAMKPEHHMSIIGVRNNNDEGKAGVDEGITQGALGVQNYLNVGLVGTNSRDFVDHWADHNAIYASLLPFSEQSVFNALHEKRWSVMVLDRAPSGVYYGTSGLYGNGSEEQTHWDSWREIEVNEGGELILKGKKVKILHHAGGKKEYKLGLHMFSDAARKRLVEIIGL